MERRLQSLAAKVREHYEADIVLYFGPIGRPNDDYLIDLCPSKKLNRNVLLIITTFGGDAHAAYRMARTFQNTYCGKAGGEFIAFVSGVCASAGTLLVMGADRLILSPHAELGPIDVQMMKPDEVGERTSGLTPVQALQYLATESLEVFRQHFQAMRFNPQLSFPTSLASKVAAEITAGLVGRLYEQIDPMRLAEVNRAHQIAGDYGERIARNLKPDGLEKLLYSYPAHDFVIDPSEAEKIFDSIEEPTPELNELSNILKEHANNYLYEKVPQVCYLEDPAGNASGAQKEDHQDKGGLGAPPAPNGKSEHVAKKRSRH